MEWIGHSVKLAKSRETKIAHRFADAAHVWVHGGKAELGKIHAHTDTCITRDVVSLDKDIRVASLTLKIRDGVETYWSNDDRMIVTYYEPRKYR